MAGVGLLTLSCQTAVYNTKDWDYGYKTFVSFNGEIGTHRIDSDFGARYYSGSPEVYCDFSFEGIRLKLLSDSSVPTKRRLSCNVLGSMISSAASELGHDSIALELSVIQTSTPASLRGPSSTFIVGEKPNLKTTLLSTRKESSPEGEKRLLQSVFNELFHFIRATQGITYSNAYSALVEEVGSQLFSSCSVYYGTGSVTDYNIDTVDLHQVAQQRGIDITDSTLDYSNQKVYEFVYQIFPKFVIATIGRSSNSSVRFESMCDDIINNTEDILAEFGLTPTGVILD